MHLIIQIVMLTPSVNDNNLNDIPVPMKCEHEYTICNSLFQTNEQDENSTFHVPSVPTIVRGNAEDNSWYRGDNKSAIMLIPSQ
jgi:hypothetical protein